MRRPRRGPRITDRIPPFKRKKPLWATRPRRTEELAILAGRSAGEGRFTIGVNAFYEQTAKMRRSLTRFTTTPDWEGLRNAHQGAYEVLK
jgi:hypothetical protein